MRKDSGGTLCRNFMPGEQELAPAEGYSVGVAAGHRAQDTGPPGPCPLPPTVPLGDSPCGQSLPSSPTSTSELKSCSLCS